jgi:hypothetical protein
MNIQSGLTAGTCWEFAIELENFIKHTNSPQIAINPETIGYVAPQRTWVGLTDEEIQQCLNGLPTQTIDVYARRIEQALKDKNT